MGWGVFILDRIEVSQLCGVTVCCADGSGYRIAPFPPHWVANIVAPHLGINPLLFWTACFIGIAPVSVIHTTIGSGLDSMTSAEDFHILSVRNVLGLLGVAVAVMIPSGLK